MKRRNQQQGGFARLMVVIVVALIAIMAAALLDQVEVDLISVGEHRRTVEAKGNAIGAMGEVLNDPSLDQFLPLPQAGVPQSYMGFTAGAYTYDPNNIGPGATPANSAYVTNAGTHLENGYTANVGFLRTSQAMESAVGTIVNRVYEVDVQSSVATGRSTDEVRTEILRPIVRPDGQLWKNMSPLR